MTWQDVRGHYIDPEPPEPLGTCDTHGDYWSDDCPGCAREGVWTNTVAPPRKELS